jgi:hypothetical protein
MLINVTSADQTIYIFISDVRASVSVGDRGVQATSKEGGVRVHYYYAFWASQLIEE